MDIKFYEFVERSDNRGALVAIENNLDIPFEIKRVYYIFNTPEHVSRGLHAHYNLKQILICLKGNCEILLDNGSEKKEVILDSPNKGLFIDKLIWREMHRFSPDCILLVLASDYYNEEDYIRNYEEYLEVVI